MLGTMQDTDRPASVADVHALALAMPHVTIVHGSQGKPVYQVGGRSFIFFRNPRPDAADPVTGERYDDVIVFWVGNEADKQSLIGDPGSPFFTTAHFDGHPSVLVRAVDSGSRARPRTEPRPEASASRTPGCRVPRPAARPTGCAHTSRPARDPERWPVQSRVKTP